MRSGVNGATTGSESWASRPVVLFDFDGTLADTGPAVMRIAGAVLRERGIEPTDEELRRLIGPPLIVGIGTVFSLDGPEAEAVAAAYRERFEHEVVPADYPVFPGVPELLDGLRAQERRLAVATSRLETSACEMLAAIGLLDRFEAVAGRIDGVRDTKADSIRTALTRLGARPQDAVMVGDRWYDSAGAHEVGLPCIGVYTGAAEPGEHDRAEASCVGMAAVGALLGL